MDTSLTDGIGRVVTDLTTSGTGQMVLVLDGTGTWVVSLRQTTGRDTDSTSVGHGPTAGEAMTAALDSGAWVVP